MREKVLATVLIASVLLGTSVSTVPAENREIRFYKLNKNGKQANVLFVRNTKKEGCHAFPVMRAIHRVAIVNFAYCELYKTKNCEQGSEIPARWKDKADKEATRLTLGSRWILKADGHVDVRAWKCVK